MFSETDDTSEPTSQIFDRDGYAPRFSAYSLPTFHINVIKISAHVPHTILKSYIISYTSRISYYYVHKSERIYNIRSSNVGNRVSFNQLGFVKFHIFN